ncbi:hypothetical protein KXW76_001082 [Aspergillus fumigatus]|nr:hypothetical protein KXW76_001082 [Aspergillus fumigatus]
MDVVDLPPGQGSGPSLQQAKSEDPDVGESLLVAMTLKGRTCTLKTGLVAKAIKAGKTVDEKTLQHFYETEKVSAIETVGLSDAKTPHSSRTP